MQHDNIVKQANLMTHTALSTKGTKYTASSCPPPSDVASKIDAEAARLTIKYKGIWPPGQYIQQFRCCSDCI
jgi:hypothetical protein